MSAFVYSVGASAAASDLWVMPLSTDYADLSSSAPDGVHVRDPGAKLGLASISSGVLSVLVGANVANMTGASYDAPGVGAKITRRLYEGVRIRARVKRGATGAGSFPSVGLAIIRDLDTATGDRTALEFRTPNLGGSYLWDASYYANATPSEVQKDLGVWYEANVGGTGGNYWRYGYTDTDDPDAVTWVALTPASSHWIRTGWSVDPTKNLPGDGFRAVVYAASDNAGGGTQVDCTYFDVLGGTVVGA